MNIRRKKKVAAPAVTKRQLPVWLNRRNSLIAAVIVSAVVLVLVLLRDGEPRLPADAAIVNGAVTGPSQVGNSTAPTTVVASGDNQPPTIVSLELTPEPIYPGMAVKVEAVASDPEGDLIVFAYEWRKNGEVLSGQVTSELATTELRKGDLITVTVVPTDSRGISGAAKTSRQLLVHNRPPEIISTPPAGSSTGHFSYQVLAQDPDGDVLNFAIEEGPPGMVINAQNGLIEWNAPTGLSGKQQVRITVTDRDAKAFQAFNLNLSAR